MLFREKRVFKVLISDFLWKIYTYPYKLLLRHRFRFSIDLILVRELTLYTLSRSTPYIVIPVFGLTCWKFTKDGAREEEIICFG